MNTKQILINGTVLTAVLVPTTGSFLSPSSDKYCQSTIGRSCESKLPRSLQVPVLQGLDNNYLKVSSATTISSFDILI